MRSDALTLTAAGSAFQAPCVLMAGVAGALLCGWCASRSFHVITVAGLPACVCSVERHRALLPQRHSDYQTGLDYRRRIGEQAGALPSAATQRSTSAVVLNPAAWEEPALLDWQSSRADVPIGSGKLVFQFSTLHSPIRELSY